MNKKIRVLIIMLALIIKITPSFSFPDGPVVTYNGNYVGNIPYEKDKFIYMTMVKNEASRLEDAQRERKQSQEKIYHGGVDFKNAARFINSVGRISAAVYDDSTGNFYLIGESRMNYESFLSLDDMVVMYNSVFKSDYEGVSVTIDPDPENLEKWGIAKYTGGIENTHVGQVLFEADRLLKCLIVGFDNITGERMNPGIEGYNPEPVISLQSQFDADQTHLWSRNWFIPDTMDIAMDRETKALKFIDDRINIKNERMEWVNGKLVTAADQMSNKSFMKTSEKFLNHLGNDYEKYSNIYPVLKELREIAKIIGIFKWLKNEYPGSVDLSYFDTIKPTERVTPVRTPVVKGTFEKRVNGRVVRSSTYSSGGVSFNQGYNFTYADDRSLTALKERCRDVRDFQEFELNGKNMVKFTLVDVRNLDFIDKIRYYVNRISGWFGFYYKKIIV